MLTNNLLEESYGDDFVPVQKHKKAKALCGIVWFFIGLTIALVPCLVFMFVINKPEHNTKPLIGIVATRIPAAPTSPFTGIQDDKANQMYIKGVQKGGGVPLTISGLENGTLDDIDFQVSRFDGILFQGGDDISPELYNETKDPLCHDTNRAMDDNHIAIFRAALRHNIPIMGICRGCQLINVASGGSMYQDLTLRDLPAGVQSDIHEAYDNWSLPVAHKITVEKNTVLYNIMNKEELGVNSLHHQTIKKVAPGFKVTARSPDGTIEGIEKVSKNEWIVGYQFHPEALVHKSDDFLPLWTEFVHQANLYRKRH